MKVKAGTEAECIRLMRLMEEHTRKEAGCVQYVGHQSQEDPTQFAFYETYAKMLAKAYPTRADGITLFPFRRLFIVARRA